MKFRSKIQIATALLALLFLLSSCKIIKFMRVKNQMADLKNFTVTDKGGLSLIFRRPLMNKGDVTWIMSTEPTVKKPDQWTYEIKKRYRGKSRDRGNFDIPIKLSFENNKLKVATLPERFTQHLPKAMFAKFIQAFGKGKIRKTDKTLHAVYKGSSRAELLSVGEVITLLGLPYYSKVSKEQESFVYLYRILSPDAKKNVGVRFNYHFNRKTKLLESITANIKGFNILIEFTESQNTAS